MRMKYAARNYARVAIQMKGTLSLFIGRALSGVLGEILPNCAYRAGMGPTRHIVFSTHVATIQVAANCCLTTPLLFDLPSL
mmetsp:Transcript_48564/g.66119  ORF Transcript_48564/g.66119 Transcript_48564/m.66119 type:complete len:81 (-) Transcript_48564:682-924(-)